MEHIRTYKELIRIPTFEGRYEYLKIGGKVGETTFGSHRYLNQAIYTSPRWRNLRNSIIVRDVGRDLGVEGYDIDNHIIIHHINPLTVEDVEMMSEDIFNPNYLICVSKDTHEAIHFGDARLLPRGPIERRPGDTCPWK